MERSPAGAVLVQLPADRGQRHRLHRRRRLGRHRLRLPGNRRETPLDRTGPKRRQFVPCRDPDRRLRLLRRAQTYDFNPTTGSQIWHYNSGVEGGGGKTPVYYNGNLYVRDFGGLTAFNAANGTQVAAFNPAFSAATAPAFSNGVGYVTAGTSNGNVLDAFNPSTGVLLWSKSLGGNGNFTSAPLVINNIVFAASSLGNVYEFDAGGNPVGTFNVGNAINGPDEQNVSQPLTGLTAGDGLLAIPAGSTLNLYSVTPEPSAAALVGFAALIGLTRRGRQRKLTERP